MDSPFTTSSSSSASFHEYNAQDDYHLDTDYVFWQASQSRCDALNNLMLEAAQPRSPNMSAISSLTFASTSSFISMPTSTPFQRTIRDCRVRPARSRPLSSTTAQQNATPSTSTFGLPGSSDDSETLIGLIKLVSQKVDENSESKRRYLEHSRLRARQKQKERKELRRKVKQNEYLRKDEGDRLDTDTSFHRSNTYEGAATERINIHSGSHPTSEPPLRVEQDNLNVATDMSTDIHMPPPDSSVTNRNTRGNNLRLPFPRIPQEQPEALESLDGLSNGKEVLNKSVPTKVLVEQSIKRDASFTPNNVETCTRLASASQNSNQLHHKPVLAEMRKVDQNPTVRMHDGSVHSGPIQRHSSLTSVSTTQRSNSKPSTNISIPPDSQTSSQVNSAKVKSKPPVLGMRRICNPTTLTANSSISNSSHVVEQPLSQKLRPFKTPFAKPTEPPLKCSSTNFAMDKEDSAVVGLQKESGHIYHHPSESKSGLQSSLPREADNIGPLVISEEKHDTSFNSSDFDMDIDDEELERVCSAYD